MVIFAKLKMDPSIYFCCMKAKKGWKGEECTQQPPPLYYQINWWGSILQLLFRGNVKKPRRAHSDNREQLQKWSSRRVEQEWRSNGSLFSVQDSLILWFSMSIVHFIIDQLPFVELFKCLFVDCLILHIHGTLLTFNPKVYCSFRNKRMNMASKSLIWGYVTSMASCRVH